MKNNAKGYILALADGSDFYIPNALHVERDDELMLYENDTAAAEAAELDGVKLIYGMEHIPDGVYLDTPENRIAIADGLAQYPQYKDAPVCGQAPEENGQAPVMGLCFGRG